MENGKWKFILLGIVILASVLRLWKLDQFPAGFNADEASIGYNAYSLLLTGKDEYGSPWPLSFKSFGDYKPGLYFYFVIPFVAIFGLNEWAVRLPSAFFGIVTVVLVYFLAWHIFKNSMVSVLSMLLLAVSPWHIHFSRGGWETNAATFFITGGVFLFLKGLERPTFLFWSLVSFLASMYTYQSPRLIVPILLLSLFILYRSRILIIRIIKLKSTLACIMIIFILTLPIIYQFTSGEGSARFSGLSFLADPGPISRVNELRGEHQTLSSLQAVLLHNKLTAYVPNFLGHYLDHFRPDFLFINGDPIIRNKVPETGQFYLIESLFLVVGLVFLIRRRIEHTKLLLAWILIAPLASAMTFQTPHALRSLNMVVPLVLIMGYGLFAMVSSFKKLGKVAVIIFITIILIFELIHYLESYFIHYPKRYPLSWEYGFKEMVSKLEKYEPYYNKVVITDRYDQPYILVLFYKKYDPKLYQPQARLSPRDKFHFGTVVSFDKYEFHSIKKEELGRENTLFVGIPKEIPENANIIDRVYFPNGEVAFVFAGT